MTYSDQDESEIAVRVVEKNGRAFKVRCSDPHGHWKVYHAKNNMPVQALPGTFTSFGGAEKAILALPEDKLPARPTMGKVVLTPKVKKEEED